MRKGIYLENTPLAEALQLWADMIASEGIGPLGGESVPVADSLGRITAEAIFAKLSSPFVTTKTRGLGLGLSLAQRIVERSGGTLSLDSMMGEGTTVTLNFPVSEI